MKESKPVKGWLNISLAYSIYKINELQWSAINEFMIPTDSYLWIGPVWLVYKSLTNVDRNRYERAVLGVDRVDADQEPRLQK